MYKPESDTIQSSLKEKRLYLLCTKAASLDVQAFLPSRTFSEYIVRPVNVKNIKTKQKLSKMQKIYHN